MENLFTQEKFSFYEAWKDDAVGLCSQWSNTLLNTHHFKRQMIFYDQAGRSGKRMSLLGCYLEADFESTSDLYCLMNNAMLHV
jgi:hypothetical protein